ncbi:MAG TPA: Rha family transcriptional regulator [Ktedonobacteraceae bacterium]|nr:Rha family transcriptional regulator [Ktedonobacteraceae bacterium]
MDTTLEITLTEGEYRIDSRLLAARLGYEHKVLTQAIRRHKESLERKSFLLQFEAKTTMDKRGRGRPENYYMLNERQCLVLTGRLKKGVEAEEWHDTLVDAFLQARERVRQLENQRQQPSSPTHTLTEMFRPRALENLLRVPDGYFSVMGELFKHLYNAEAMLNRSLDKHAMIEISVGLRWSRYARETLGIPDHLKCKYPHVCQGGRIEQVWAYPMVYANHFAKWLWNEYFSREFSDYERYRARHLTLPVPPYHPRRKRLQLEQRQLVQQPSLLDE